ncbi:methyltransferase [Streptomyces sp. BPPL-273]|uniref:methyltransferase n=1 Tax=Streptomyces TaxID=1883 RepID=UPI001368C6AA|nr:methyltransferase [Streptomyces sp. BPPL-273]MZD58127.1 methyltransferase [Streptomyces sp. SID5606]WHM28614.1 methyltransferase [Streptomyces sp. BPPL-273]
MKLDSAREVGADYAAVAALLQIGAELGVDRVLDSGRTFGVAELAEETGLPRAGLENYLHALSAAGLVTADAGTGLFRASDDYADWRHEVGYLSWALTANSPFLQNARAFLTDGESAARTHRRDGRRVAVSSRWIGDRAFYPAVVDQVVAADAKHVVDLGAGAAGLLIDLLGQDDRRTGVALDLSAAACAAAREDADRAGVGDRLRVVERSVESLIDDPGPLEGADVIQACFVMHDVLQDESVFEDVLRTCRKALAPGGVLAVVDAVSYGQEPRERKFSALFTYLHANFMDVALPTPDQWVAKFRDAGFSNVECVSDIMPGGRLFVATK